VVRDDGGRRWRASGDEQPQARSAGGVVWGEGGGVVVCSGRGRPQARDRDGSSELGRRS
jgi:hypothetical protein